LTSPLLVIGAGGTGGHMFPAQALAQEMLRRGWRVALSSDARGLRYAGGFPEAVARREARSATFARGGLAAKLGAPLALARGALETRRWFRADRPACVAGFGGYPAFPALAAAWLSGLPRLIHEQNGVLGRVNRLFAARVGAVACGTWPVTNAPAGAALLHVGNPVRDAVRAAAAPYAPPGAGPLRLLVFGGSQGARLFGRVVPRALAALPGALRARLSVVQQARPEDADAVRAAYADAGIAAEVAPFFEDMPARMAAAHLVIARAGASTVAELGVIGRPAILVPYAAAMDDHQTANARALTEAGGAETVAEAAFAPEALTARLAALLPDGERLTRMAAAAKEQGAPDAAAALADLVERLAREGAQTQRRSRP
jgi:UDP-N-acetylglucosamine--N-acetylmuramyl-(pentapeptide) pyrophosphoryl-undecaprenol N-acetylglucosamine transferase